MTLNPNFTRIFTFINTRVMTTKLTLTVEKNIIEGAKAYASAKGRSLSELVESYLKTLIQNDTNKGDFSPDVRKLLGSVKAPKNFDYKKALGNALTDKYSRK